MSLRRILFFGDSLTAGYGLKNASTESFPALIQNKINSEKLPYEVVNAGLSGDTSAGGLSRINYWLSGAVDVFILELGVNDMLRGISPAVTHKNLDAIIKSVRSKHPQARLALMGMEIPDLIAGNVATEFRKLFRKLADQHQLAFVPFFLEGVAGRAHLNLMDGLHPSAAGYRIIADNVWPTIKKLLND